MHAIVSKGSNALLVHTMLLVHAVMDDVIYTTKTQDMHINIDYVSG